MTFTVTYRSKTGAKAEVEIEAASRSECMAECKRRGIAPVSVREGKRKGSGKNAASQDGGGGRNDGRAGARPSHSSGGKPQSSILNLKSSIILAATFLAIGGGLWLWLAGARDARPYQAKPPATDKPKVQKRPEAPPPKPKAAPAPATNAPVAKQVPFVRPANWKEMTKEERAAWNEEHPRPPQPANVTMGSISDLRPKKETKPIFHHHVQLELSHYAIPGRDMPPPDRITDKEALAAADVPVEYLDDDTAELRAKKEAVEGMLQEMKEYILNGGHANDYMKKLAERQQLEGEAVEATRRDVRNLMREGKTAEAKEALETYNDYLKSKGIPPIRIKGLK